MANDDTPQGPAPDFSGMASDDETPPDLGIGSGDMKGLSDLVNSMASARAPVPPPQQQAPQVPRPGLPNIVQFIGGLINPSSPRFNPAGSSTGSRAPVFENFIANTLYALGQGFANEGHGPGAAMRGAGSAMVAPYQRDVQNFQLQNQANQQAAQTQQTQAQTDLTRAQTSQMGQMVTIQTPSGPMMLPYSLAKGAIGPSISAEGRVTAANIAAKNRLDVETMKQSILNGTISRVEPGKDANGNFGMMAYNRQGQPIGMLPGSVPPASYLPKTSTTVDIKEDANGAYNFIPKTSTTTPVIPGGAPVVPGAATPLPGATPGGTTPPAQVPGKLPGSLRPSGGGARPVTNARPVQAAGGGVLQGKSALEMGVAFDPQSNERIWTSRSDANQKGYSGFSPAGRNAAQAAENYRMLNVRLGDVEQKIQEYSDTMKGDLGIEDRATMAAALAAAEHAIMTPGILAKAPGPEGGFAILNEIAKGVNLNELSKPAYKRLQAYVNAREAMNGYSRVLAGSGQSSDTSLHLNLSVLPHPLTDAAQAPEGFNQFRQNLDIVEQGVPRMQGVKAPKEWRGTQDSSGPPSGAKVRDYTNLRPSKP